MNFVRKSRLSRSPHVVMGERKVVSRKFCEIFPYYLNRRSLTCLSFLKSICFVYNSNNSINSKRNLKKSRQNLSFIFFSRYLLSENFIWPGKLLEFSGNSKIDFWFDLGILILFLAKLIKPNLRCLGSWCIRRNFWHLINSVFSFGIKLILFKDFWLLVDLKKLLRECLSNL